MRNGTAIEIELTLIRHGETKSNYEHRYLGQTEEPLSEQGRVKIQEVAEKWNLNWNLDLLLTSPMKRCQETADILFPAMEQKNVDDWREMDFGMYEGKNYQDLKDDPYYQKWIDSNGTLPFPEGESQKEYIERCLRGMAYARQMIRDYCMIENKVKVRVAAVVHGGTIMALLSALEGGSYFDYHVKNGQGYCLELRDLEKELCLYEVEKLE